MYHPSPLWYNPTLEVSHPPSHLLSSSFSSPSLFSMPQLCPPFSLFPSPSVQYSHPTPPPSLPMFLTYLLYFKCIFSWIKSHFELDITWDKLSGISITPIVKNNYMTRRNFVWGSQWSWTHIYDCWIAFLDLVPWISTQERCFQMPLVSFGSPMQPH